MQVGSQGEERNLQEVPMSLADDIALAALILLSVRVGWVLGEGSRSRTRLKLRKDSFRAFSGIGLCFNEHCECHTTMINMVVTPFPLDMGPIYCCNGCASTRRSHLGLPQ